MSEVKFPIFFRVLAPFNLILGVLFTIAIVVGMTESSGKVNMWFPVVLISITGIWFLVSAFAWFFASGKSYTFLYTTIICLLLLAGYIIYSTQIIENDSSKNDRAVFLTISIVVLVYSAFVFIGLFFSPVKKWQSTQKSSRPFTPNPPVSYAFLLSLALSFTFVAYMNRPLDSSNDPAPAMDTTAVEETYEEPIADEPPPRDFPIETLTQIYSGFTIDSAFKYYEGSPYLETGDQISINGKQYGQFVGGPLALMKELTLSINSSYSLQLETWLMYDYVGRKQCFETMSGGIEVYQNYSELEEHSRQYNRQTFQKINIAIVEWGARNFIPGNTTIIYDHSTQEIYDVVFRRFFRLMAESYRFIRNNRSIEDEMSWYVSLINDPALYVGDELDQRYSQHLSEYVIEDCPYYYFKPGHAVGFWIRRSMDGTDQELYAALRTLMREYDNDWWFGRFGEG